MSIEENIFGYKVQTKSAIKKCLQYSEAIFSLCVLACSRRAWRRASNFDDLHQILHYI